ncbi:uracil-DNA glycosylase family protein [Sphingomonas sp. LM7]|uniref:uracil-DNA glycosylase family protein n=1 Tax=Sphingomonas sp. LM7 TaxID=1938607 RepID=UPI000983BD83|nr:uracil-DNA glycosylase family protein [Sphingomonas sp. LM7]AQR73253.1 uracil-DNA glycosylase [Sphingomonas sp. LM7]
MGGEPVQDWQKLAASALEWWRDAGVDMLVEDDARDWLARTPPPAAPETVGEVVAATPVETLPDTIEAFLAWRTGEAAPEAEWHTPRFVPTGPIDAEWVVVTDVPEAEDSDRLLSGPAGRLLDKMLAAVGQSRESVHVVPIAFARPLTGRISPDDEARLIELARHHLDLLQPKMLFLLGQSASRVLDATDGWPPNDGLRQINQFGTMTRAAVSYHPRWLLERPAVKREAWKHLLLLSRGPTE